MDHLMDYGIDNVQVEGLTAQNSFRPDLHSPKTKQEFHQFPKQLGWKLDADHKLDIIEASLVTQTRQNLDTLLTAWLFFGLIMVIVQENDKPILTVTQLQSENYWLNTKELNPALERWVNWETHASNRKDLWARMIQAEYVLEKARKTVRKNCGYDVERDRVEYHTDLVEMARHVTDEKAMALMTLGETLWQVKVGIMQTAETANHNFYTSMNGWHGDDDDGWGPPRWVFKRMDKWCPRAVRLLKGQLRSSATLLLQAYYAYKDSTRMTKEHSNCTTDTCEARTLDEKNEYSSRCIGECQGCEMVGPNTDEVRKILETNASEANEYYMSDIPVLRFTDPDNEGLGVKLEVTALPTLSRNETPFATISHVWSDGWGNEKANALHTCQLQFLRRQMQRLNKGKDVLFWMDTLIIPVKKDEMSPEEKQIRKKAVRQIFDVYEYSKWTIVLDNGLFELDPPRDTQTKTAMMILASSWMRRLWTLQEAFMSQDLRFVFKEKRHDPAYTQHIISFDDLMHEKLAPAHLLMIQNKLTSDPPRIGIVQSMLGQNIMCKERRERHFSHHQDQMLPRKVALLVASAWFAARWRTTSNTAHETLALATLLDLKYENTIIEEAGLRPNEDVTDAFKEDLVCEFWETFRRHHKNAIPPGIIFLPGEKLGRAGFGWAPKTWMSAHEVDYPNPLRGWNGEADLVLNPDGGLRVRYPGFKLHTVGEESRKKILFMTNAPDSRVTFPSDRTLVEWYSIKPADSSDHAPTFAPGILTGPSQLAIILSRPRPGASPPEIGLLVEIHQTESNTVEEENGSPYLFRCRIIRRVHVWREMVPPFLAGPDQNGPISIDPHSQTDRHHWKIIGETLSNSDFCLGEVIPSEQSWLVDGYPRRSNTGGSPTAQGIQLNRKVAEQVGEKPTRSFFQRWLSPFNRPTGANVLPGPQRLTRRTVDYPPREITPSDYTSRSSMKPGPVGIRHENTLYGSY